MIYTVYLDNYLLYDPRLPDYAVIDPVLNLSANEPGMLTFTVPETNPNAGVIQKLVSRIKVFRDGTQIFQGRVIKDERGLGNTRKYTVPRSFSLSCLTVITPRCKPGSSLSRAPAPFRRRATFHPTPNCGTPRGTC